MIHIVFNRPAGKLKVFGPGPALPEFDAGGDSVTDGVAADGPYGHLWPTPPGHYILKAPESLEPPLVAEGAWQIPVDDISDSTLTLLAAAGDAKFSTGGAVIGGLDLPLAQLARFNRSAILIHGGGTALGNPACFSGSQPLCKTEGCTRMHNADLATLVTYLQPRLSGNTVVYSIFGSPMTLSR